MKIIEIWDKIRFRSHAVFRQTHTHTHTHTHVCINNLTFIAEIEMHNIKATTDLPNHRHRR
jgi:hypothetical protein